MLWFAGLCVHTPSLTAAMPGLSHRRALLLNLSGSFVSNLLPLGGAAGTVVNWRMARTWGFSSGAFSRWAVVTNLADTVVKLALPGVVLCWFAVGSTAPPRTVGTAAAVGAALLVVTVIGVALVARDDRALRRAGRWADRAAARVRLVPGAPEGYGERAARFRSDSARLVRDGWGRMLGGKLGYAALQALLLWACLRVVGGPVAPLVVASAFVVERVLSMVVADPGGDRRRRGGDGGRARCARRGARRGRRGGAALPRARRRHGGARRWSGAARVVGRHPSGDLGRPRTAPRRGCATRPTPAAARPVAVGP